MKNEAEKQSHIYEVEAEIDEFQAKMDANTMMESLSGSRKTSELLDNLVKQVENGNELRPNFGQCFLGLREADEFIRMP